MNHPSNQSPTKRTIAEPEPGILRFSARSRERGKLLVLATAGLGMLWNMTIASNFKRIAGYFDPERYFEPVLILEFVLWSLMIVPWVWVAYEVCFK